MPGASSGLTRERGRATRLLSYSALLRVGFAEPARSPAPLVSSYLTVSPLPFRRTAVCFLWHWSVRLPALAVSQHPALRSPDFPPAALPRPATVWPSLAPSTLYRLRPCRRRPRRGLRAVFSAAPVQKGAGGVTGQRHDYRLRLTPALEGSRSRRRYRGSGRHAPRRPRRRAAQRRACWSLLGLTVTCTGDFSESLGPQTPPTGLLRREWVTGMVACLDLKSIRRLGETSVERFYRGSVSHKPFDLSPAAALFGTTDQHNVIPPRRDDAERERQRADELRVKSCTE